MSDLPTWAQSDERHPEREAEWRRLTADLTEARGMVAALRAKSMALYKEAYGPSRAIREVRGLCDALGDQLDMTASAAREHEERVRAECRAEMDAKYAGGVEHHIAAVHQHQADAVRREIETAQRLDEAVATARAEGHAAGFAEARIDVARSALAQVGPPPIDRDLARRLVRAGRHHLAWENSDERCDEVIDTVLRGAQ